MNLRISEKQLRFRITRDEVQHLLQGQPLSMSLPLSYHVYTVKTSDKQNGLSLQENGDGWMLWVSHHALQALTEQLPSREGLSEELRIAGHPLTLMLEVDVRKSPKA